MGDISPSYRNENGIKTPNLREENGSIRVDTAASLTHDDYPVPHDYYSKTINLNSIEFGDFDNPTYTWTRTGGSTISQLPAYNVEASTTDTAVLAVNLGVPGVATMPMSTTVHLGIEDTDGFVDTNAMNFVFHKEIENVTYSHDETSEPAKHIEIPIPSTIVGIPIEYTYDQNRTDFEIPDTGAGISLISTTVVSGAIVAEILTSGLSTPLALNLVGSLIGGSATLVSSLPTPTPLILSNTYIQATANIKQLSLMLKTRHQTVRTYTLIQI